ncbi:MAG: YbaN family protein [Defluviitaleaceae bacterium]|nr:YbaN family protein [Defluviitaleaceae bacterium]
MQPNDTYEKKTKKKSPIIAKMAYIFLGLICLGLGTAGIVLPLIPTTPFALLAAFCFGKSSIRLHNWFTATHLYKNSIEGLVKNRTMTKKAKLTLLATITAVMGLSLFVMRAASAPIAPQIVLGVVWGLHVVYFGIRVKII